MMLFKKFASVLIMCMDRMIFLTVTIMGGKTFLLFVISIVLYTQPQLCNNHKR